MKIRGNKLLASTAGLMALIVLAGAALAAELKGTVKEVDTEAKKVIVTEAGTDKEVEVTVNDETEILDEEGEAIELSEVMTGATVEVTHEGGTASKIQLTEEEPE
jgi:hypothetical protein